MADLRHAAQQALEALETCDAAHISDGGQQWYDSKAVDAAITALEAALAEPAPEPFDLNEARSEELFRTAFGPPPHPGDFGIPQEHRQAAQAYANWWHENRQKAQRPEPQPHGVKRIKAERDAAITLLRQLVDTRHKHYIHQSDEPMWQWDERVKAVITKAGGKP